MKIKGHLTLRECYTGSKSEGLYPFLTSGETEYKLCRNGVYPANDPFFDIFNGCEVEVQGEYTGDWFGVEEITPLNPDNTPIDTQSFNPINKEEPSETTDNADDKEM